MLELGLAASRYTESVMFGEPSGAANNLRTIDYRDDNIFGRPINSQFLMVNVSFFFFCFCPERKILAISSDKTPIFSKNLVPF